MNVGVYGYFSQKNYGDDIQAFLIQQILQSCDDIDTVTLFSNDYRESIFYRTNVYNIGSICEFDIDLVVIGPGGIFPDGVHHCLSILQRILPDTPVIMYSTGINSNCRLGVTYDDDFNVFKHLFVRDYYLFNVLYPRYNHVTLCNDIVFAANNFSRQLCSSNIMNRTALVLNKDIPIDYSEVQFPDCPVDIFLLSGTISPEYVQHVYKSVGHKADHAFSYGEMDHNFFTSTLILNRYKNLISFRKHPAMVQRALPNNGGKYISLLDMNGTASHIFCLLQSDILGSMPKNKMHRDYELFDRMISNCYKISCFELNKVISQVGGS